MDNGSERADLDGKRIQPHSRAVRRDGKTMSMSLLTRRSLLHGAAALPLAAAPRPRPNVIVILADDLGYADTGFTGAKDIPTPNIDRIARAGVRFTNAYVSHPFCSPTSAGLMTGRYQQRFGHENNPVYDPNDHVQGLPADQFTLAQVLSEAGYLGEMVMPVESGRAVTDIGRDGSFFRHTAVYENSKQTVGFSQNVANSGRPLWNCPGFGVIKNKMED